MGKVATGAVALLAGLACSTSLAVTAQAKIDPYAAPTTIRGSGPFEFRFAVLNDSGSTDFQICFRSLTGEADTPSEGGCAPGPAIDARADMLNAGSLADLPDGTSYEVCAYEKVDGVPGDLACPSTANGRPRPVVDNTDPSVSAIDFGGTGRVTNQAVTPVAIWFDDPFSEPWNHGFGQSGPSTVLICTTASSSTCTPQSAPTFCQSGIQMGTPQAPFAPGLGYTWRFGCPYDFAGVQGPHTFCAIVADNAMTDAVDGAFAFNSTVDDAHRSPSGCATAVHDSVAPTFSPAVSASSVAVGQAVTLRANAADATSGFANAPSWSFGDGTAPGSGATVTHAFVAAGTKTVTVSGADRAGNTASATVAVTVTNPPVAAVPPPTVGGASGGATVPAATPGMRVRVPRKLSLKEARRRLAVKLSLDGAGIVAFALRREGKIVAKARLVVRKAGRSRFELRLPAKVRPGKHALTVKFTPPTGTATRITSRVAISK